MSATRKPANDANLHFYPKHAAPGQGHDLSGKRRQATPMAALRLRWPDNRIEQGKLFEAWHDIAGQIVNDKGGSRFRLLSAVPKLIYWKAGIIPATNEQWASRCGRCAVKTVTRDIELYRCLGIFIVRYGWRKRKYDRKIVKTRLIFPALPETLKASITLPDNCDHMDTRGPDEWGVFGDDHMDTRGPDDLDTRGPGTFEAYEEAEGGNDAA